jgi:glyoxylase-like metal-dependent hydrolase (beta-lactamase superfamily II)
VENRYDPLNARNPGPLTGLGNNTWLIDGDEPTLIDAGVGHPNHLDAIARALDGRDLARVLVTHGHLDHASGIAALRARWPEIDARKWPSPDDHGAALWRPLGDGDRVPAGAGVLVAIHTPGHAPDHVCFWEPDRRDLYAGDMLVLGSTVMIPAGRGGDLRAYLASLDRLAALRPLRVLPGHGAIIDQPLALIASYIAHRHDREEQVLAALAAGVTTAGAIVGRIYPDLAEPLRSAATATIQAHLDKIRLDRPSPGSQ